MNRWTLLAGLGMIRFGMEIFEEAIKKLGGPKMRQVLQRYTNKGRKSALVGTITTGVLNSSTLVSLLTLGFVSAGLMQLINAIGVLVGANIGSTFTAIIVGYLGFGEFKISLFALPLIALGGILLAVTSKKYRSYRAKVLLGFGLFFLGIDFLKDNIDILTHTFDLAQYQNMSLWIFGLIGLIVTMLVQSSGAVTVMTLAAFESGIVNFEGGFAIVLGAAIGTSFTALFVSLAGTVAKKQLAIANLIFNALTVVLGVVFFKQFIRLTLDVLGYSDNKVMGIAMINMVFSTLTSLAFVPILKPFTKAITWLIPDKDVSFPLAIIQYPLKKQQNKNDNDIASLYLTALEQDKQLLLEQAMSYMSDIRGVDITSTVYSGDIHDRSVLSNLSKKFYNEEHKKLYEMMKEELDELFVYTNTLVNYDLDQDDHDELIKLQNQFKNISIAIKATKNCREIIDEIRVSLDLTVQALYYDMVDFLMRFHQEANLNVSHDQKKSSLALLNQEIQEYRDTLLQRLAPGAIKGDVGGIDISSLNNTLRELSEGYKYLTTALL